MNSDKQIKCYPCFDKDINGGLIVDSTINDPYNINGGGSKCHAFDTSFPNKNNRPKDYLICQETYKQNNTGCGNQEVIISDKIIDSDIPKPDKKGDSAAVAFILSLLGIISIFIIIMWVIYKTFSTNM